MIPQYTNLLTTFLAAIFFCYFACGNSEATRLKNEEATRWKEVMSNHDVVMPLMGTTNKVRQDLKKLLDSDPNMEENTLTTANELVRQLDKADESMMDWMNRFQQLEKLQQSKNHEEIMQYLAKTDAEIKAVGRAMNKSIKDGLDFLESIGPQ